MAFDSVAELPRTTPSRIGSLTYASTTVVSAAAVQSMVNLKCALPGPDNHLIVVQDNELFTGQLVWPARSGGGTGWIVLQGQTQPAWHGTPLLAGQRVHPLVFTTQAKFRCATNQSVIRTSPGTYRCGLRWLDIGNPSTNQFVYEIVSFGDPATANQTVLGTIPEDLFIEQCLVVGNGTSGSRRGVGCNAGTTRITECYISRCFDIGADSQGVCGWNGPGPYLVDNNYIEAAGENIMWGGADPGVTNLSPSDITVRRNHTAKDPTWKTQPGVVVKNILDSKNQKRGLYEANVMEGNWPPGQDGTAIVLKSSNQSGTAPWSGSADLTFRRNVVRDAGAFIVMTPNPEIFPALPFARGSVHDNVVLNLNDGIYAGTGRDLMLGGGVDYQYIHNTAFSKDTAGASFIQTTPFGSSNTRCLVRDNISAKGNSYGVIGDSTTVGGPSWNNFTDAASVLTHNVIGSTGGSGANYTGKAAGNFFPAHTANIGFTDATIQTTFDTADPITVLPKLVLANGSTYKGAASDGTDPGADIAAVLAAIAGVWLPGEVTGTFANYAGPGPVMTSPGAPPVAAFTVTPTNLTVACDSTASSSGVGIASRAWSFGDGTTAGNVTTVSHTYVAPGTYPITLTVTDTNGVVTTLTQSVVVTTVIITPPPVVPGIATQLVLTRLPAGAVSGKPFLVQPQLEWRDVHNQLVPTETSPVVVTVPGNAATIGTTTVAAVGGKIDFTGSGLGILGHGHLAVQFDGVP